MADPVRLTELLAEIGRLYATLRQERDKESAKAFGRKLVELRTRINEDILRALNIVNPNTFNLDDVKLEQWKVEADEWKREKLRKVDEKVVMEESAELSDFFGNVSNSVIQAQRNLNEFSKNYVDNLKDTRVQPTYFAIPGVRAEMKLGFSELTSKGINVIIFKSEDQKKRYLESTVAFDIVSTPPVKTAPPLTDTPLSPPAPHSPVVSGDPLAALRPGDFEADDSAPESGPALESLGAADEPAGDDVTEGAEREPEVDELLASLRDARASLFAATDRLVGAREEFDERARKGRREPETPLVRGDEHAAVLQLLASEHERRAAKLEESFERTRRDALVLKYTAGRVVRYLVLWPGREEDAKRGEWGEMRIYDLAVRAGELRLDGGAFSHAPKEGYLTVGARSRLLKLKKDELADLLTAVGDALSIITNVFREWLEDVGREG